MAVDSGIALMGLPILAIVGVIIIYGALILIDSFVLWIISKLMNFTNKGFLRALGASIVLSITGLIISFGFGFIGNFLPSVIGMIFSLMSFFVSLAVSVLLIKLIYSESWLKAVIAWIGLFVVNIILSVIFGILMIVLIAIGFAGIFSSFA
ncbi:MAG: hypothetical protein JW703_05250 [Candidatus Diapherotrites archaeon]|nr:hypothetical protein [Candidatus Diapherotrites archaeon]